MDNNIFIYLLLYLNILSLILGYIIGKISIGNAQGLYTTNNSKNSKPTNIKSNNIAIDDKKIVVDINTSGLEKKYNSLGHTTNTDTNITNSVNKLKNLKK